MEKQNKKTAKWIREQINLLYRYFETIKMLKWNCAEDVMRTHAFFIFTRTYRYHKKGWKYRLKTNNRYRYSLLFGYRMQKFFTF